VPWDFERAAADVSAQVLDAISDNWGSRRVDLVLCRLGLMHVPGPESVLENCIRSLKPDGRLALTVWGPTAGNPWPKAIMTATMAASFIGGAGVRKG